MPFTQLPSRSMSPWSTTIGILSKSLTSQFDSLDLIKKPQLQNQKGFSFLRVPFLFSDFLYIEGKVQTIPAAALQVLHLHFLFVVQFI